MLPYSFVFLQDALIWKIINKNLWIRRKCIYICVCIAGASFVHIASFSIQAPGNVKVENDFLATFISDQNLQITMWHVKSVKPWCNDHNMLHHGCWHFSSSFKVEQLQALQFLKEPMNQWSLFNNFQLSGLS